MKDTRVWNNHFGTEVSPKPVRIDFTRYATSGCDDDDLPAKSVRGDISRNAVPSLEEPLVELVISADYCADGESVVDCDRKITDRFAMVRNNTATVETCNCNVK